MSRVHALFTRPASARKPLVQGVALPAAPEPRAAPQSATRDRCACGRTYGNGADVWRELRGGVLRATCGGCGGAR